MTSAELTWKKGFAPLMSKAALDALLAACETDDKRLTQGSTTTPPPLKCVADWPCEGACLLGFCGWQGDNAGDATVGEVEEYFAVACFRADEILGEPAACRWLLNWFDDTPRSEMLTTLAGWVRDSLAERAQPTPPPFAPDLSDVFG